jgi:hypothetical protein
MASISRSEFISQFANSEIDLNNPDPELTARLAELGVGLDDLRAIAGKDGIISGHEEAKELYYLVENHDHNGTFKSLEIGTEADGMSSMTEAGEIYETLAREVERHRLGAPPSGGASPAPPPTVATGTGKGDETKAPADATSGQAGGVEAPKTKLPGQVFGGRTSEPDRQAAIQHYKDKGWQEANFTPATMYYTQADPAFRGHKYPKSHETGEDRRLLLSGCGPTALAMVDATLRGTNTSPIETADYAVKMKYSGDHDEGTHTAGLLDDWSRETGLQHHAITSGKNDPSKFDQIKETIDKGGMVMIGVGPKHFTDKAHVMVINGYGKDKAGNEYFFIANPGRPDTRDRVGDGMVQIEPGMENGAGMVRVPKDVLFKEMKYAIAVEKPAQ